MLTQLSNAAVKTLIALQSVKENVIDVIAEQSPLFGAIVALLIIAVTALSSVVVFLFRLYARESKKKDDTITELNLFIRTSYHENTQILNDMIRVIDILTQTTESVGDDIKSELEKFMIEMRAHISVLKNIQKPFGRKSDGDTGTGKG